MSVPTRVVDNLVTQSRCGVNEGTACRCSCVSALRCLPPRHRKINSPYKGTLSSYGYVLLVIYFLVHVKNPPVLPNLQQMPPMRPISHVCPTLRFYCVSLVDAHTQDDTHIGGYNTWYTLHWCAMLLETDKLIILQVL